MIAPVKKISLSKFWCKKILIFCKKTLWTHSNSFVLFLNIKSECWLVTLQKKSKKSPFWRLIMISCQLHFHFLQGVKQLVKDERNVAARATMLRTFWYVACHTTLCCVWEKMWRYHHFYGGKNWKIQKFCKRSEPPQKGKSRFGTRCAGIKEHLMVGHQSPAIRWLLTTK